MPSVNRPNWRGVSTTREQSIVHHLTQELLRLEQSTILMRQNLENANVERINNNSSEIIDIHNNCEPLVSEENTLKSWQTSSEELKLKIQSVLKSNAEIKTEMKTYFEQSEAWNLEFMEESKKIDAEFQAVISSPSLISTSLESSSSDGNKLSTIITNKARNWYNMFGIAGRNVVLNIRRKLEAVAEQRRDLPEHDASYYYAIIPYL